MSETRTIPNKQPPAIPATHKLRLLANSAKLARNAAQANEEWLSAFAKHGKYAITLQTNIGSDSKDAQQLERKRERVGSCLVQMLPRLNRKLTGNGWQRKKELIPLFAATIQTGLIGRATHSGPNERKTLHVHAVLGNIKDEFTQLDIQSILSDVWTQTAVGTRDIDVRALIAGNEAGWAEYITREWVFNGNNEPLHIPSLQAPPQHLLQMQALGF